MKILCLASGRGTNFEAIVKGCRSGEIPLAQVVGLICNKSDAPAIQIARRENVPCDVLPSQDFLKKPNPDRAGYDRRLAALAEKYTPDVICLTGYMLLLGKPFLEKYSGKILNIHPSLLPNFPGLHAPRQALEAQAAKTGCTVHLVDESLDGGPILDKTEVPILPGDTEATLTERIRSAEHATYQRVLKKMSEKSRA